MSWKVQREWITVQTTNEFGWLKVQVIKVPLLFNIQSFYSDCQLKQSLLFIFWKTYPNLAVSGSSSSSSRIGDFGTLVLNCSKNKLAS